jgi:hypothetical protein
MDIVTGALGVAAVVGLLAVPLLVRGRRIRTPLGAGLWLGMTIALTLFVHSVYGYRMSWLPFIGLTVFVFIVTYVGAALLYPSARQRSGDDK